MEKRDWLSPEMKIIFSSRLSLNFRNNNLYDLSDPSVKQTIEIADVMKTMDNRIKLDKSLLEEYQAN